MMSKSFVLIGVIAWLSISIWLSVITYKVYNLTHKPVNIEFELKLNDNSEFMKDWEANVTNMLAACTYYDIKCPKIVTAQAILESGNFKSNVFKKYNNPFGLYNSKTKDYFKFEHWTDAVVAYKNMIQYRYKEGDYYIFLKKTRYAEDPNYINKVKAIENSLKI